MSVSVLSRISSYRINPFSRYSLPQNLVKDFSNRVCSLRIVPVSGTLLSICKYFQPLELQSAIFEIICCSTPDVTSRDRQNQSISGGSSSNRVGLLKRTVGSKNREIFSMLCESLVISVLSGGQGKTKREFVRENVFENS